MQQNRVDTLSNNLDIPPHAHVPQHRHRGRKRNDPGPGSLFYPGVCSMRDSLPRAQSPQFRVRWLPQRLSIENFLGEQSPQPPPLCLCNKGYRKSRSSERSACGFCVIATRRYNAEADSRSQYTVLFRDSMLPCLSAWDFLTEQMNRLDRLLQWNVLPPF